MSLEATSDVTLRMLDRDWKWNCSNSPLAVLLFQFLWWHLHRRLSVILPLDDESGDESVDVNSQCHVKIVRRSLTSALVESDRVLVGTIGDAI
jgi:hypothetical protein